MPEELDSRDVGFNFRIKKRRRRGILERLGLKEVPSGFKIEGNRIIDMEAGENPYDISRGSRFKYED